MSINRRIFLKSSGAAAVGTMLLPPLFQSCGGPNVSTEMQTYLNHFEVTLPVLQKVIAETMAKGGTYADLFFEHKISNYLGLQDGKVNRAYSNIDYGVGIRALNGDQTGFAYSETITPEAMIKAAQTAANIASGSSATGPVNVTENIPANYYPIQKVWEDVSVKDKIPFVQKLNDKVFSMDKRVIKVNVYLSDETGYVMQFNSEGILTYDYRPMVSFSLVTVMQKDGRIENSYVSRSFRKGFEFLNDEIIDTLADEGIKQTSLLFEATKPKAGEMPVVMGAGGSGILLHEAIGHTFEADFNRKGTSIFADKMGKKVAENFINIIDDGTLNWNRGSINVDDEGVPSQKTYLVKDGVLNSYLHDRISAGFYKVPSTGSGRRESFRYAPIPRMRATYMESGNSTRDDIISEVKYGIYVDTFSNGEVKIGAGDFTFFVNTGYLIENGKLTRPIKDINIIGNGPKALADITMAANDYKIDNGTWTCGKDGQSVPVTCGLPSVLVKKLTVGGTNA